MDAHQGPVTPRAELFLTLTRCTVTPGSQPGSLPGSWDQKGLASFLFSGAHFHQSGSASTYSLGMKHLLSSKTSLTIKVSFVCFCSKKDVSLIFRRSDFLVFCVSPPCPGAAIAAKMNPKEEKVKIITEVSGCLDVPLQVCLCVHGTHGTHVCE